MKRIVIVCVALLLILLFSSLAQAQCKTCQYQVRVTQSVLIPPPVVVQPPVVVAPPVIVQPAPVLVPPSHVQVEYRSPLFPRLFPRWRTRVIYSY